MADSSLDDFFAKKDKSKKKNKSKVTPGDILSKQESELSGKKGKKKKDKDKDSASSTGENDASNRPNKKEEDEEWVDFEQETEKDYSGLRIQNLQISKEDADQEEENKENENNDDEDENGEKRDVMSGPWNKSSAQPQTAPTPQPKVEEKPPPAEPVAKTPGKYVPPSLRGGASASPSEPTRPTPLRKKKVAPNLQSEEDFPTLGGGGGPGAEPSGGMSFEKVQSGNRMADDPSKLQSLTLGNKFSALQD